MLFSSVVSGQDTQGMAIVANKEKALGITIGPVTVAPGHVAFAYQNPLTGLFVFGSVGMDLSKPTNLIDPKDLDITTEYTFDELKTLLASKGYTSYKAFYTNNPNFDAAAKAEIDLTTANYNLFASTTKPITDPFSHAVGADDENCLTGTKKVLEAYGVDLPDWDESISGAVSVASLPNVWYLSLQGNMHYPDFMGDDPMIPKGYGKSTMLPQPPNMHLPSGVAIKQVTTGPLSNGLPQSWAVDADGKLWTCWLASSWSDWYEAMLPSGVYVSQAKAVPLSDGRLRIWIKDTNGKLWLQQKLNTICNAGWTDWIEISGLPQFTAASSANIEQPVNKQLPSGTSIVQLATGPLSDGRPQSAAADTDGKLWVCWMTRLHDSSSWTGWTEDPMLPSGVHVSQVEALPLSDGRLRFWIKDANGRLWLNQKLTTYANAGWTGWIEISSLPQFPASQS